MNNQRKQCIDVLQKIIKNKKNSTIIEKSIYSYSVDFATLHNMNIDWNNKSFKRIYSGLFKC